ncbi:ABC transporter substrate-binding protein [Stygiolobus caldivivus]|uniref:ABC transporter substrate-binding protein n=1 Tax=Stygiolobus caldivivus TaxID=2824673 RepID=A0A8D5U7V1_9CREN|nr:ABC transporter substrate-binding protein [Stygiolobus caldivivus]BCU70954.1 ABC transporter substrate-binding protein [Stygiolobus caldivivus]
MKPSVIVGVVLVLIILVSVIVYMHYFSGTQTVVPSTTTAPPKNLRIVSLAPSDTQILISLGLGKDIVGMDIYSYQLLEDLNETSLVPSNVTVFNNICPPNISGILLLHPNKVLVEYGLDAHYIPEMEKAGLPLMITNNDYALSLAQIEENIISIAESLNDTQAGMQVVKWMESQVENYTPTVSTAYFDWICSNGEAYTAGGDVFINNVLELAGGYNVFENFSGYPEVTPSKVLLADPSIIIAQSVYNYSYTMTLIKEYFTNTSAVEDGKVYIISGLAVDLLDEPGPLSVYGVIMLHKILTGQAPHYVNTTWVRTNINVSIPVY